METFPFTHGSEDLIRQELAAANIPAQAVKNGPVSVVGVLASSEPRIWVVLQRDPTHWAMYAHAYFRDDAHFELAGLSGRIALLNHDRLEYPSTLAAVSVIFRGKYPNILTEPTLSARDFEDLGLTYKPC